MINFIWYSIKKHFICILKGIEKAIYDDGVEHAGYMAFMLILALFPFLVFFLSATSFFGASEIGRNLVEVIIETSPDDAVESIKFQLEELKQSPPNSLINLAIFGTIWTSSSFVEGIRTILNRIFEITSPPPYLMRRLLSIMQFLILCGIIALIMYIFLFIPVLLDKTFLNELLIQYRKIGVSKYIYIFISLFLCTLSFYKFIPNTNTYTLNMIPGALFTAISWQISGYLLSKYIKYYYQLSIIYGSLGSIIVTLLFFYLINLLFIIGAGYNYHLWVYAKKNQPKNFY